jgi:preprotein translocase subunit SecA
MYEKLAGMTGTAETEATEFNDIYRLAVQVIPTNKPCIRIDKNDVDLQGAPRQVQRRHARDRGGEQAGPAGAGRHDERRGLGGPLADAQARRDHPHGAQRQVPPAGGRDRLRAGLRGAVTIATNMAGRGTDIKLGEGVRELGGLYVIGTERHESRRIDRQLRGRCSRQGDPGLTKFFLSLEDDLMRLFLQGNLASR